MNQKACTRCKIDKPRSEFTKLSASKDGLAPHCKACAAIYKAANRERAIEARIKRDERLRSRDEVALKNEFKRCVKCCENKHVSEYHRLSASLDGLQYTCKECAKKYRKENSEKEKERSKKYAAENKDKIREYQRNWERENKEKKYEKNKKWRMANREAQILRTKEWQRQNKERDSERKRKWRQSNPELVRALRKKWYIENPEKAKQMSRQTRERNPENCRALSAIKRARKRNAVVSWTEKKEIKLLYKKAKELTISTGINHHVDHIIPLTNPLVCGLHVLSNLQILTEKDNLKKHNSFSVG